MLTEDAKGPPPAEKAAMFVFKANGARHTSDDDFRFRRNEQSVLSDDVIHHHHTIRLGWMDRIRALFGRTVHLNVQVPVRIIARPGGDTPEVQPGACKSQACVEHVFRVRVGQLTTSTKA